MRAKPLRTLPACLITSPTHIPPALFVNIGTRVNIVHSSKNPRCRIFLPSSLVTNDADNRRREAMHNSTVKKRALRFITCKLFWVIAPARPERKDATKIGNTPCEKSKCLNSNPWYCACALNMSFYRIIPYTPYLFFSGFYYIICYTSPYNKWSWGKHIKQVT